MKRKMIFIGLIIGIVSIFLILGLKNESSAEEIDDPITLNDAAYSWFMTKQAVVGIHYMTEVDHEKVMLYLLINQEPGENLYVHYDLESKNRNGELELFIESRNAVDDSHVNMNTLYRLRLREEPTAIVVYVNGSRIEVSECHVD